MDLILIAQTVLTPSTNLCNSLQIITNPMSYLVHYSLKAESLNRRKFQIHLGVRHHPKPIFLSGCADDISLLRLWPGTRVGTHDYRLAEGTVSRARRLCISMSSSGSCCTIELAEGRYAMGDC